MTKFKNKYVLIIVIILLLIGAAYLLLDNRQKINPRDNSNVNNSAPALNNDLNNNLTINQDTKVSTATIKTSKGEIEIKLYYELTPDTVDNFVKLAQSGFYDGIYFHRVIADFMIQTGDPQAKGTPGVDFTYQPDGSGLPVAGTGGPGYRFADEFTPQLRFDKPGLVAMANSGPNTNGSQFFITHVPTAWLNDKHTIFGQVVKGQEVVDSIEQGDKIESIIIQ